MTPTILSFIFYLTLLGLVGIYGLRNARPALISVSIILAVLTVFRQLIFYTDLDQPFPQGFFSYTEWNLIMQANLVCTVWIIVLMLGYELSAPFAKYLAPLFPQGPGTETSLSRPRGLKFVVWAPASFAILGTLYLVLNSGGFAQFIYDQKIGKEFKGLFIFKEATTLTSILALYGFLVCLKQTATGRVHLTWGAMGYLAIIIASMATNYAWGNRYNIALTCIAFGLVWHYYVAPLNIPKVLFSAIVMILALQALRNLRGELISSTTGSTLSEFDNPWLSLSTALHFVEFDAFMLALRDAGRLFEFRQGQDFLNGLLSWVPRSIYPDKETFNIGPWFRRIYQPEKINGWPVTTIGAWYVNFGYMGIVYGGMVSGLILRAMDIAFSGLRKDPWKAAIGIGLAIFMIEGGINTGFPQGIVLLIIPLSWASMWLRINKRPTRIST